eukprot:scaffold745_cov113-Isochrysis_galbana.AAC.4
MAAVRRQASHGTSVGSSVGVEWRVWWIAVPSANPLHAPLLSPACRIRWAASLHCRMHRSRPCYGRPRIPWWVVVGRRFDPVSAPPRGRMLRINRRFVRGSGRRSFHVLGAWSRPRVPCARILRAASASASATWNTGAPRSTAHMKGERGEWRSSNEKKSTGRSLSGLCSLPCLLLALKAQWQVPETGHDPPEFDIPPPEPPEP